MAEEPENLVLALLREMRADIKGLDEMLREVRRNVAVHDLRFDALDENIEMIREGKQITELTRRVERPEAVK